MGTWKNWRTCTGLLNFEPLVANQLYMWHCCIHNVCLFPQHTIFSALCFMDFPSLATRWQVPPPEIPLRGPLWHVQYEWDRLSVDDIDSRSLQATATRWFRLSFAACCCFMALRSSFCYHSSNESRVSYSWVNSVVTALWKSAWNKIGLW